MAAARLRVCRSPTAAPTLLKFCCISSHILLPANLRVQPSLCDLQITSVCTRSNPAALAPSHQLLLTVTSSNFRGGCPGYPKCCCYVLPYSALEQVAEVQLDDGPFKYVLLRVSDYEGNSKV